MRILVAGWHGQIAMALSEAAARRSNVKAYAVGRPALDLTDRPSIGRTLFGIAPNIIINTAAYTDVEGAEREPDTAFKRNTTGAAALASQAARNNIPIIHLSSVYVFDGRKSGAYTEDDPTKPINAYGRSKQAGEVAVAAANPMHIILRTGWIHSPFGRNFVTNMTARSQAKKELQVDETQQGSPSYAPHLATAILDIAAHLTGPSTKSSWGTYHLANSGTASWYGLAQEVLRASNNREDNQPVIKPVSHSETPDRAARPQNARLDCTRLNDQFGIELPSWQDGIHDCVARLATPVNNEAQP